MSLPQADDARLRAFSMDDFSHGCLAKADEAGRPVNGPYVFADGRFGHPA
jgi:hypothetical protein